MSCKSVSNACKSFFTPSEKLCCLDGTLSTIVKIAAYSTIIIPVVGALIYAVAEIGDRLFKEESVENQLTKQGFYDFFSEGSTGQKQKYFSLHGRIEALIIYNPTQSAKFSHTYTPSGGRGKISIGYYGDSHILIISSQPIETLEVFNKAIPAHLPKATYIHDENFISLMLDSVTS